MKNLILSILVCLTVSFISFQSYAAERNPTIYIQIPIEVQDKYTAAGFAEDYLKTTGEIFVLGNMMEEKGEYQMTGSSVATEADLIELKKRWSMIRYSTSIDKRLPDMWVPKIKVIE